MELKIQVFQGVGKSIVDGFICLLCLFPHIAGHIPFVGASALLFLPFFEGRKLFLMAAGTDEALSVALSDQLHLLMADRTAGVGAPGDRFPVSTFPVLAYEKLSVLTVDLKKEFPALRALMPCQVVVAEGAFCVLDLIDQRLCVVLDLGHEPAVGLFPEGDRLQTLLPLRSQFRTFEVGRDEGEKLFPFGGDMDLVSLFLHQEAVEELLYDVCAGGDSSKPSGLAQRADDGLVLVLRRVGLFDGQRDPVSGYLF